MGLFRVVLGIPAPPYSSFLLPSTPPGGDLFPPQDFSAGVALEHALRVATNEEEVDADVMQVKGKIRDTNVQQQQQ